MLSEKIIQIFQQAGVRMTPQRQAVCAYVLETDEHPTAAQIHRHLSPLFPSLSLATVYNTLELLVNKGIVNEIGHAGDNQVHYDGEKKPHVNLACVSCHTFVDVYPQSAQTLHNEVIQMTGYNMLGSRFIYYGLCNKCQATLSKSTKSNTANEKL